LDSNKEENYCQTVKYQEEKFHKPSLLDFFSRSITFLCLTDRFGILSNEKKKSNMILRFGDIRINTDFVQSYEKYLDTKITVIYLDGGYVDIYVSNADEVLKKIDDAFEKHCTIIPVREDSTPEAMS
jgi:hypothetical protein